MTVVVTGAGGVLGGAVVEALHEAGLPARGLGRGAAPAGFPADWRRADLLRGEGLVAGLAGATAVIHCASAPLHPGQDLLALDHLLAAMRAGEGHLVQVGIAGLEDAAQVMPYYRTKLAGERKIAASGVPYTVCRSTQFHPFVDYLLGRLGFGPVQLVPRLRLQPVDPAFVARCLVRQAGLGPQGRVADIHGPEVLDTAGLVGPWLAVRHRQRHRVRVPVPSAGPLSAFRRLRVVAGVAGGSTWQAWLAGTPADAASGYDRPRS